MPIRYIILVFFLIIIISILFFKSKQGFLVTSGGIVTVAGNGMAGFSGDGGPATRASFNISRGIAIDSSGNIYITDISNRVRKVDVSTGNIETIAGTGTLGSTGDGGPAKSATFSGPSGIAVDSSGNIYIADTNNNRIRKVDVSTGNIETIAGTGTLGSTGDDGSAKNANLNNPRGIAIDSSGNIYIADTNNHRIRKVDRDGKISRITGNSTTTSTGDGRLAIDATINNPTGITTDSAGNIYIVENSGHRIRKVDKNGIISTVAGTGVQTTTVNNAANIIGDEGPALSATFSGPSGIAVDLAGNIYIADTVNNRIRKVDKNGIISTVAGNGLFLSGTPSDDYMLPTNVQIVGPSAIAIDSSGNIYIVARNRIRKIYK